MRERIESGLSIRAYCKNAGFHENVYYYWQRKLRQAACEQLGSTGFAEVKLVESSPQSMQAATPVSGQISVEVAGVHITADSSYPIEKLTLLVKALGQA